MSWQSFLDEGSGGVAFRVSVEGLAIEFVTDPALEQTTTDARRRVLCMDWKGIVLDEKVNIPEATIDVAGNRIELYETEDEDLSSLFMARASVETVLAASATVTANVLTVTNASGIAAGDVAHIGTEAIKVLAVSGNAIAVASRGYWGTTAQAHYSADSAANGQLTKLRDRHRRLRGRRVRIYAYGEGDDPTGDGTQIWLGIVQTEAALDDHGIKWSFQCENIAAALRTKLGNDLANPLSPRGIYYHWAAPLAVFIAETGTANRFAQMGLFFGFYETQQAFISALQAWLDARTAAFACVYRVVPDEGGTWSIEIVVTAPVTDVDMRIQSDVDGRILDAKWLDSSGAVATAFTVGQSYRLDWTDVTVPGARGVPRGRFGMGSSHSRPGGGTTINPNMADETQREAFPETRIYVSHPIANDWSGVTVEWGGDQGAVGYLIVGRNTATNSIEIQQPQLAVFGLQGAATYTPAMMPSIKPARTLGIGTIADLRDAIVLNAPVYANRGATPWLTDGDIADWTNVVAAASRGLPFLEQRTFLIYQAGDLAEYLAHHFRLYSVFPILDDEGKIALKRFEVPNASTADITVIDDEVLEGSWATLSPDDQGSVNTVVLKLGYDPREDKHARTITIVDQDAYTDDHETRALEVEPKSITAYESRLTPEEAAQIFMPVLGYFGAPVLTVTISVTWQLFPLRLGDVVSLTSQHLPAFTGVRPMSEIVGVVVGRRWVTGEASGQLRVLVTDQNVAGYSPAAYIGSSAFSNVAGNTWDITITTGRYAPSGHTEDEFFVATDVVRLVQYDSVSPVEYTGTVVSVNTTTHVIRVTFTSALSSPGTSTWWLQFASYSAITTDQRTYCVIASDDERIGGTSTAARTFAP